MASFACYTNTTDTSANAYQALSQRFRKLAAKDLGRERVTMISTGATWAFYQGHMDKSSHTFKDFTYQLNKANFSHLCISMSENPTPEFKRYVRLIETTKLKDGIRANGYYGEIKKIVTAFINFFTHIVDDTVKRIDRYKYFCNKENLIKLINRTIEMVIDNQEEFVNEFKPISEKEQKQFDESKEIYFRYLEYLRTLKESCANITKHETLVEFAEEQFDIALKKIHTLCTLTHSYISLMLADRIYEIAVSVAESVDRMNFNKLQYNEECMKNVNNLINELYDKNKEKLNIYRRHKNRALDTAAVNRAIEIIKDEIHNVGNEETLARLELENSHWKQRLEDCNKIAQALIKMRYELDSIEAQEKKIKEFKAEELPGTRSMCFKMMCDHVPKRKKYLEEKWVEMAKTLITFFCCRGTDRVSYVDYVGSYYCDEFNHQNYVTDHGLKYYHVNCYGDFIENVEWDPYYFNENGRYIINNQNEEIYQCAPCTSHYKLGDDGLLKKITKDCGHSERMNKDCRMHIKDLTDVIILPKTDNIDISRTLDHETAKYLWDSFGMILPAVLYDIVEEQPKNPIHCLAHVLLKHKYETSKDSLLTLKKEADIFRTKFYNQREEEAAEIRREWKSKLVKRRKPEESDDTTEWAVYNQQVADWQFVNSLGYYD